MAAPTAAQPPLTPVEVMRWALVMADLQMQVAEILAARVQASDDRLLAVVTVMIERGLLPAEARASAVALVNEQAAARAVDAALDPALESPLRYLRGLLARVAAVYGNNEPEVV